jgi:hypothetical protein
MPESLSGNLSQNNAYLQQNCNDFVPIARSGP